MTDLELEAFKDDIRKNVIDKWLSRLLDLRNAVKDATSYEEVNAALHQEIKSLNVEIKKNEAKKNKKEVPPD